MSSAIPEATRSADQSRRPTANPPEPVADLPGFDLKPDPLTACSAADLIRALRQYRIWAGDMSFRTIARRSGCMASASAICIALGDAALSRDELPRLVVVIAVVAGCGGNTEEQAAWATAWRLLRFGRTGRDHAMSQGRHL